MLTLICGLPNAGKTTHYSDALHQDEIGTIDRIISTIKDMPDVTIEGYFGRAEERSRVRSAHKDNAICIFINISVEESIRRENRNRHPQILRNAARFFEPPTLSEGWDEIITIHDDNVESIKKTQNN